MVDENAAIAKSAKNSFTDILKALAAFLTALAALIAAIFSLWQSTQNKSQVAQVERTATRNATDLSQIEQESSPQQVTKVTSLVAVQLASYLNSNCDAAKSEMESYDGQFKPGPNPTLWSATSSKYVVVGIKASNLDEANKLRTRALELSKDPRFLWNDLQNAKIRTNPDWTPLASCPD